MSEENQKYSIKIDNKALKFLKKLDDYKYDHLVEIIFELENEPRPVGCTKLNVTNGFRVKWSKYRILYTVDNKEKIVKIYKISHRKEAYR